MILKKERTVAPSILFAISIPFYFLGFYSITQDGEKVLSTLQFWKIGLTNNYDFAQRYLYTNGPDFVNGIVGMLIFSLILFTAYCIVQTIKLSGKILDKFYYSLSLLFSGLSYCFYLSAVFFTALFYSNLLHASYCVSGEGRIEAGAVFAIIFQTVSFWLSFINFDEYVYQNLKKNVNVIDEKLSAPKGKIKKIKPNPGVQNNASVYKYYLVCCGTALPGAKIELQNDKMIYIGRDPQHCQLIINPYFRTVARIHCGVVRKGSNIYLQSISKNGVYYSDNDVKMQEYVLNKIEFDKKFNLAHTKNEFYCKKEYIRKEE